MGTQQYVSMQVWQAIQRKPSLISLPPPELPLPQYFPIFSPSLPSLPCPALPCHPCWRVRHTSVVGFTTPVCRGHTIFLPPHLYIPRLTLPHLPCHVCVRVILGGWCQEFPEIGTTSCRARGPVMTKWFTISWSITNRFTADNIEIKC